MPRGGNSTYHSGFGSVLGVDSSGGTDWLGFHVWSFTMPVNGWITEYAIRWGYKTSGTAGSGRAALYVAKDRVHAGAVTTVTNSGPDVMRVAGTNLSVRAGASQMVSLGLQSVSGVIYQTATDHVTPPQNSPYTRFVYNSNPFPSTLVGLGGSPGDGVYSSYYDYIANEAPGQGGWTSPAAGATTNQTPTFQGTAPHNNGDGAYDYSSTLRLQIKRTDTNAIVYDDTVNFPGTTGTNWSYTLPISLAGGVEHSAKFLHADSWGSNSPWSVDRLFTPALGPDAPITTTPAGKINQVTGVTFAGSYSHPTGATSDAIQVQVLNAAGTSVVQDSGVVTKTVAPGAAWTHAQWFTTLSWNTSYLWQARFRDTIGNWGAYSTPRSFKTDTQPNVPTKLSPASGQRKGDRIFTASVSDPDNDPITGGNMELVNAATGATVRYGTPWAARTDYALNAEAIPTAANGHRYRATTAGKSVPTEPTWPTTSGATVRDNVGLTAIARSTAYVANNMRLRPGGAGTDSDYYECTTAGTTAATAPTYPYPNTAGATVTDGTAVFTCRKMVVWTEAGVDSLHPMTVSADGLTISYTMPSANMTLGTDYRWRAQASDGILLGAFSSYVTFTYAIAPDVSLKVPQVTRTNYVQDPQAEYDTSAAPWWTFEGQTATNSITRYQTLEAAFGSNVWRSVTDGTAASSSSRMRSPQITLASGASWFFSVMARKVNPLQTTSATLAVLCYNAAGTLLGTVYPSGISVLNATNLSTSWTRYGGRVYAVGSTSTPAFPTGTTQFEVLFTPSSTAATVEVDAFQRELVPSTILDTEWAASRDWFGFFDGDPSGFNAPQQDYTWNGTPGLSTSSGPAVLTATPANLVISYSSSTSLAKLDDRLTVQRWSGTDWVQTYQSAFVASTRTTIPVPSSAIINEARHRLMVEVHDSSGTLGSTPWVEFDTRYPGPPELNLTGATPDPDQAIVDLLFDPTTLSQTEFGGIEVAVESAEEGEKIVALLTNPAVTSYRYHFPVAGRAYAYKVRQIQNVGAEQVEGRWKRAEVVCDYSLFFVKDAEDPESYWVAYDVERQSLPQPEMQRPRAALLAWGSQKPASFRGESSWATGEAVIELYDGPEYAESADERYRKLALMFGEPGGEAGRTGTVCLLSQTPKPFKVFASPTDAVRLFWNDASKASASFGWVEDSYSEDYRERGT